MSEVMLRTPLTLYHKGKLQKAVLVEPKTWRVDNGLMGKNFYLDFVKSYLDKSLRKKFEEIFEDEDGYVEYYSVSINDPNDYEVTFSILYYFDVGLSSGCIPVYINRINTSSCMALCMCNMAREYDEGEEPLTYTLEELMDMLPPADNAVNKKYRETIKKILLW
jgi:hypothetical protein